MNYKIAVYGHGKTGQYVVDQVPAKNLIGPFGKTHPASIADLNQADLVVLFVPASAVMELSKKILRSGIHAVWGATGYDWQQTEMQSVLGQVKEQKLKWIHGNNFSLGMAIIKNMIHNLALASELLPHPSYHLHEIHHTKKLDAPSGTAKNWMRWLGHEVTATHERIGDTVGFHQITMETDFEKIVLSHEAKDRGIFAAGALWAAEQVMTNEKIKPGLTLFEELTKELLTLKTRNTL
jgi:4-hydroxy-tetrahydrodipicolinate reductase